VTRYVVVGLTVLVLAVQLLLPGAAAAIGVVATIPVGREPYGVATDDSTNTIYVTNEDAAGTVSVIDGATNTVTATVPVGSYPFGAAVDATTHLIYVSDNDNTSSGTVSVIDGTTNAVTASIPLGIAPEDVAVNATTHLIYTANFFVSTVSVIDPAFNQTATLVGDTNV
jgi:YVTN family beta-propeller protein